MQPPHPGHAEPPLRLVLGAILRRTRREQGRTLKDVAAAAQVSMPYLSEIERGLKEASSELLACVCTALGLTVADLLALAYTDLVQPVPQPVSYAGAGQSGVSQSVSQGAVTLRAA